MEKLTALLAHWERVEPQQVPLGRLKTDAAFQPRDPRIAPFRDRDRLESESARHVARLADHLESGEVEPLLVADVGGALYVVDGHHRLMAHRRVRRSSAAARVIALSRDEAVAASKLVNCRGAKLPMHAEQARECAWQALAAMTLGGRRELPQGVSLRSLREAFGPSHETLRTMLKRLPEVKPEEYSRDALDPGTDWPRWRYVKGNAIRDRFADVSADLRLHHRAEKVASKLAAMLEREGAEVLRLAAQLLREEVAADLAQAAAETAGDDDDY
jgi:ParB-like chromosome segregation protein Spo0J